MNLPRVLSIELPREQALASAGYVTVIASCGLCSWIALSGLRDDFAALQSVSETLEQIEARRSTNAERGPGEPRSAPTALLSGETVTLAGAALQQHIVAAITRAGGRISSVQTDLSKAQSDQDVVRLSVNYEMDQAVLQPFLYEVEAGAPFVFIDQIVIQAPQSAAERPGAPMHVRMDVSARWRASK